MLNAIESKVMKEKLRYPYGHTFYIQIIDS